MFQSFRLGTFSFTRGTSDMSPLMNFSFLDHLVFGFK